MTTPRAIDAAWLERTFELGGSVQDCQADVRGHVNDSFVVTCATATAEKRYLVQRLNRHVFGDIDAVMGNLGAVTRHLRARLAASSAPELERRTLQLVPTRQGEDFALDARGDAWRVFHFIEGAMSADGGATLALASEAGRAFGRFQSLLADYPGPRLAEVIPGFHDTPRRFAVFRTAVDVASDHRRARAAREVRSLLEREALASALVARQAEGLLPERIVHNDAKIDNLLFDARSGEALCVVDLDTVMPGLAGHDFGDLVRSAAATASEDETDLARVDVDAELFAGLCRGYLETTRDFLTAAERQALLPSALVIVYEQALRFLTDYLDGDRYYKVDHPEHNLERARNQLRLLERLEAKSPELATAVERLARDLAE